MKHFLHSKNVSKFSAQIQLRLIPNHAWGSYFHAASTILKYRLPLYPLLGMATVRVWDGHPYPIPILKYLIISHPRPKPKTGRGPHSHPRLECLLKSHTRSAPPRPAQVWVRVRVPYTIYISNKPKIILRIGKSHNTNYALQE